MRIIDADKLPRHGRRGGIVYWRDIEALPSAQAEIIRCKDCIHHHYENGKIPYCDNIDYGYGWKDEDYCSRGERQ